jgi:hypothetical protein
MQQQLTLKEAILANHFVEELRCNMRVDRDAYAHLCRQLKQLAEEWRGTSLIDKELMSEMYVLPIVTKGAADAVRSWDAKLAEEVDEMAIVLDGLVMECLSA